MSLKDWEKLNITRDEVNRIGEALKDETFRKMFTEYCEEITDPENRKIYESEITQLEKERGVDVTFINPEPGYVLKTSSDGTTKTFINIATSDKVDKPSSTTTTNADGQRGMNWTLPYTLAPPRRDFDKKSQVCLVYDAVFHPDTLHLASRNAPFRKLVHDTAIDAVERTYNVQLDRANLKFPKITYKGIAKPTVIRKRTVGFDHGDLELNPSPIDSMYPPIPAELEDGKVPIVTPSSKSDEFAIPKYKIVQRRGVELDEMTCGPDAKMNLTIPSELVVTIDLPLLNTSQDANLDVTKKRIFLMSEKPAKYRLDVNLPYEVCEENGSAKFDKMKRQLVVTLPVVSEKILKMTDFHREDSGIESDPRAENSDERESPVIVEMENLDSETRTESSFLESNIDYVLPSFTFNQIDEIMAFTLHVKNVDPSSIFIDRKDLLNVANIKFSSIGAGFFPIHYSFVVKFPSTSSCIFREITAEAWDNNVIFQFELNNYDFPAYEAGLNEQSLISYDVAERTNSRHPSTSQGEEIEDDSLSIEVREEKKNQLVIEVTRKDSESETFVSHSEDVSEDVFEEETEKRQTKKSVRKRGGRAKKMRSMSESYCDELKVIKELDSLNMEESKLKKKGKKVRSMSESSDDHEATETPSQNHDHKYKSILKSRTSISECNESSVEFYSMSADFGICQSHDSLSESCKKTVRFSDIIKRQLFRSNASILAQKKKNQKKKASRKRALDRRHSEGSESEKHDEDLDEKEDGDDDDGSFEHVTDNMKVSKRDSGVDLSEKPKMHVKNRKSNVDNGGDIHFKSGLIFDLEM